MQIEKPKSLTEYAAIVTAENLRHSMYSETVDYAEEMAPHAFKAIPGSILTAYRPLEDKHIYEYRTKNYEAVSYTEFGKALGVVSRVFMEGFFSIEHQAEISPLISAKESPEQYFEKDFGPYGSVLNFMHTIGTRCLLGDPNSVLTLDAWSENEGEFYKIRPMIWSAESVVDFKPGEYYLILTNEKSTVRSGKRMVKQGIIYRYYGRNSTIKLYQVGKITDNNFAAELLIEHDLGTPTARRLGGNMKVRDGIQYFISYFDAALPYWNKMVREDSDQDGNVVRHAHPQKIYADMQCPSCKGERYVVAIDNTKEPCKYCKGTGVVMGSSPYRDLTVDPKVSEIKPSEVVHVVEESTAILEFAEKRIQKHRENAMDALLMSAISGVNELNSGRAKEIDRQDLNMFLNTISGTVWDLVEFIYETGTKLRYMVIANPEDLIPKITRPVGFDYATLDQLIEEEKKAKEACLGSEFIRNIAKEMAIKRYGKASQITKKVIAQIELDPYYGEDPDVLMSKNAISPGAVKPEWAFISINMSMLLAMAEQQNADFYEKPRPEQFQIIEQLSQALK